MISIIFWYLVGSLLSVGILHSLDTYVEIDEDEEVESPSFRLYLVAFFGSWISIIAMIWGFIKAFNKMGD